MTLLTALRLGRVSNLPTVWSNVVAATALAGAVPSVGVLAALCAAMSCVYVGGMYLNDAFDREYDARFRPERPIPSGQVRARTVFAVGFALLIAGVVLAIALAARSSHGALRAGFAAIWLGAMVVFYDVHHKQNPLSPAVMAACRVLVYVTTAYCVVPEPPRALWLGALVLFGYLIALSAIAKREVARNLGWLVSQLIAGIALLDAALTASTGQYGLAGLCVVFWFATLAGQRFVPGT